MQRNAPIATDNTAAKLLARVAHDIASPIVIMDVMIRKIEGCYLQNEYINTLRVALQRIREITNTLLDQQRGESTSKPIWIQSLLNEVISLKRSEWSKKPCDFIADTKNIDETTKIIGNDTEIKRLLSNLLNNAMEACRGDIKITLDVKSQNNFIEITISDNGVGIPPEKISPCLRGVSTKHSGPGLGLSGAKEYMEKIDGELLLKSRVGVGTSVCLRFGRLLTK